MTSEKSSSVHNCELAGRGIQFAVFGDRILAADEHCAIVKYCDDIPSVEPDDDDLIAKTVYGAFKPQPFLTEEEAIQRTRDTVGNAYGVLREDHVLMCELSGIEFLDPHRLGAGVNYPFVADIRTNLDIDNGGLENTELAPGEIVQWSLPFFVMYSNRSPAECILNRPGILCVCAEETGTADPSKAIRFARSVW